MNTLDTIILALGIGFSFLIIYWIDNGMQIKLQLYFFLAAIIPLLVYAFLPNKSSFEYLNWGFLSLPGITIALYNLLNLISWKVNKREFRLKIKNSRNIYNDNTNWTDRLFSFILIINFFVCPISIAFFLKQIVGQ
ncbi:hypothetical protein [Ferruginibacter albus]|uniref:hypothetical protein n=1 Tax=Ferruginibacter albus TaxID=2875540 RepID=UPI001CC53B52|nr:hypothetical protein [Ferruginibacter albus]UAY52077.1 hypothetical protein K9M53_15990 [Ferruginibacter albus]